jgi:DNA helicase-2/ATP-dependent DNA helicase PcrA
MKNLLIFAVNELKLFLSGDYSNQKRIQNYYDVVTNGRIVVFDTETTGLDTVNDDIIQIAAVEIVKGKPGRSIESYFATDKDLSPTQTIHNISNEHLEQKAINKKEGLRIFLDFIANDALLAHNIRYDYSILNSNLLRVDLDTVDKEINPLFCTLILTRQLCKLPSYKLGNILTSLDLEGDNSHDAMDDTKATVNLALYLRDKINATK